jgi:hypothetical protein
VDFESKLVRRDKDHFLLIKGTINQEEITIINLYAANVSAPNFIKHALKDLKPHIDPNTVIVEDFNTVLSPIDRSSRQEINKEFLGVNDPMDVVEQTIENFILQQQNIHSP